MSQRRQQVQDIIDEGALHKYYTAIPNTVVRGTKSRGISIYAKWLYVYLKSVIGDSGTCYRSTTTIAEESGMSRGQVSSAKKELARKHLITVETGKNPKRDADQIRIKDIWPANMQEFCVHNMNSLNEAEGQESKELIHDSVHHMNTETEQSSPYEHQDTSEFTIRTQSSCGELGVHNMNQRRSLEEDPLKKKRRVNPSVLSDDKTSPLRLTPTVLMAWYNAHTPETHPKVHQLSPARRTKAEQYLRMFPDADFWMTVFAEIGHSAFLQGLKPSSGHESFKANFDWLLSKGKDGTENCVKVAEGQYRDRALGVRDQLSDLEYRNLEHMHHYLQENAHGSQPAPSLHD